MADANGLGGGTTEVRAAYVSCLWSHPLHLLLFVGKGPRSDAMHHPT